VRRSLSADVPLAITEQSMTKAMNALYIADGIGQLAASGVEIANRRTATSCVTRSTPT